MWKIALLFLAVTTQAKQCNPQRFSDVLKTKIQDPSLCIIESADIRELCKESFKTFPNLQFIVLRQTNISYIEPGTFNNIADISLELEQNALTEIIAGIFNGTQITSISLQNNQISTIENNAFDNMPNLLTVLLNNNRIAFWNNEWFQNTPKLNTILISSNLIENLQADTLKNFQQSKNLSVLFDGNKIKSIDEKAFNGLKDVTKISLARNELETFPPQTFTGFEKLKILDLKGNQFQCLSQEQIRTLRNIEFIKFQGNPLSDECKETVKKYSKEYNITVFLSDDPFSYK